MAAGAFAQSFADWMDFTIQLEPWLGGHEIDGTPTRGVGVSLSCHVEEKVRHVRDVAGVERVSNTTLYVLGGPLTALDRITMPPSFKGNTQPPIINIENMYDPHLGEFSHCEVYL